MKCSAWLVLTVLSGLGLGCTSPTGTEDDANKGLGIQNGRKLSPSKRLATELANHLQESAALDAGPYPLPVLPGFQRELSLQSRTAVERQVQRGVLDNEYDELAEDQPILSGMTATSIYREMIFSTAQTAMPTRIHKQRLIPLQKRKLRKHLH